MKKSILASCIAMIVTGAAFAQPVSDRAVVPVAVTLNQVLRLHVINGGNIEFVLNQIDDFRNGVANSAFYDTDIVVASSTDWEMNFGAEDATFMGTDNIVNTLALNNVGFTITETGTNTCCTALLDILIAGNVSTGTANALVTYPVVLITTGATGNAGDVTENAFTFNWECGTQVAGGTSTGVMNATSLLDQSITPDRYVTNVLFDIDSL